MNSNALNNACVIRWKKAKFGCCIPKAIIIIPSCLKVERAIIFFISFSKIAEVLAIRHVMAPR